MRRFSLDPAVPFETGQTLRKPKRAWLCAGAAVLGLATCYSSGLVVANNIRLLREWVAVEARVVDTTPSFVDPARGEVYRPVIEYTDRAGNVRRSRSVHGTEPPSSYELGSKLRIYYRAALPEQAAVAELALDWAMPVAGCAVGVILLGASSWLWMTSRPRARAEPSRFGTTARSIVALVLGTIVPFICVIRPGDIALGGFIVAALSWGTGLAFSRAGRGGRTDRTILDAAFGVCACASVVHIGMLRGIVGTRSMAGVVYSLAVIWIGVRHLADRRALTLREALASIGVIAAVGRLQLEADRIIGWDSGAQGFPPPWPLVGSVLGLVASRWLGQDASRSEPQPQVATTRDA